MVLDLLYSAKLQICYYMLMAKSTTQSKDVPIIINPTIQMAFVGSTVVTFLAQFGLLIYQFNKYNLGDPSYRLNTVLYFLVPALYWLITYLMHPASGILRRMFQTTVLTTAVWLVVITIQQFIMTFYATANTNSYNTINWIIYSVVGVLYVGGMSYLRGSKRRWK